MSGDNTKTIIIVGGGLVGSLCAIFMARRGHHVTIFEYREDMRAAKVAINGRSINMALSHRGRKALKAVGLERLILESAIPMKGRLIHDLTGKTKSILYDSKSGQCIYSIGRSELNETLLTEFEKYANVKIHFSHKLISANFDDGTITVLNLKTQDLQTHYANLIIGADGAFSTLRRFMQITPLFELSQKYIKHGYLELQIPPKNGPKMVPNHLHIWPRDEFMMIALPNLDRSWTVTLFMPFDNFSVLKNGTQLVQFFRSTFSDALPLIGEQSLVANFFKVKPSPLVSIQCNPYHTGQKFLIIGDAAHAMVPFYGQGMNAGFEDCQIFDTILHRNGNDVTKSLKEFSRSRMEDAHAICDLAMYNYMEMRSHVTKPSYLLRKTFDDVLYRVFPERWVPLYNSVTFSDMSYRECIENRKWQDVTIGKAVWTLGLVLVACVAFLCLI